MRKMGDRREDGYVFVGYNNQPNGKTYEMWKSLDKFLKKWGYDFFERREARIKRQKAKNESREKWHAHMAYLATLTDEERKEKKRFEKRNYRHRRRARINNCEIKATPKMVEDARNQAGDRCYYCGKKAELTLDHFEPLAKGGSHCVLNFVFCCHPCNSRKRDLDPFDFMASNLAVSF
jgi:hypothetical protein